MSEEITNKILKIIEEKKIAMKPKWYFVLHAALAITGVVGLIVATLFVTSFAVFTMMHNGIARIPLDSVLGWLLVARNAPWMLIVIAVVFMVLLEVHVRRYSFSYKRPLMYTATGIILLCAIGSFLLVKTPFHEGMLQEAREHRLPLGGPLYRAYHMKKMYGVRSGIIESFEEGNIYVIHDEERERIIVTPVTRMPYDLKIDDEILVVGNEQPNEEFVAVQIKRLQ